MNKIRVYVSCVRVPALFMCKTRTALPMRGIFCACVCSVCSAFIWVVSPLGCCEKDQWKKNMALLLMAYVLLWSCRHCSCWGLLNMFILWIIMSGVISSYFLLCAFLLKEKLFSWDPRGVVVVEWGLRIYIYVVINGVFIGLNPNWVLAGSRRAKLIMEFPSAV